MICNLCPKRCNAERTEFKAAGGFCGQPLQPTVARAALHFWEEPCISGEKGSGTVFFAGCNLNCVFCQNYEVSHNGAGKRVSCSRLAEIFRELEEAGALNINLVTPSHFIPAIISALKIYRPSVPLVYNSSGYDMVEAIKALEPYVDIFLMDLKYLTPERAAKYSGAANYPEYAATAIKQAYAQQPECVFENGIMKRGLIVRHLLLPAGTAEAMRVFDWVRVNTPNAYFSIMSQYLPLGRAAEFKEINRRVTAREYDKVLSYICASDFENIYIQDRKSSDEKFVPSFDFTGV